MVAALLFIPNVIYSFQVAAQNSHGVGSFSNPVTTVVYSSQGKHDNLLRQDIASTFLFINNVVTVVVN